MPKQTPIVLADAGHLTARIVTRPNPSPVEEFAAEELRRYLCQMAGAPTSRMPWPPPHLPRIYLNDPEAARTAGIDLAALALPPEGYHLESRGRDLHILGGGDRGLLYGVYELLESLGCRWFATDVTTIPCLPRIELAPLRKTGRPAFEFRDHFSFEAWDPSWSVRNRLNGNFTSAPAFMGGHDSYGLFVHTFYALLPPEEFFDAHPEYFSLVDGARRRQTGQLCLTNPEVVRIVTERVLERMRKYPRARIFSVSQNDFQGYCTCPECNKVAEAEGSQAGPLLHFVNAIATETSKVFPDKLIDTLAYEYTLKAPRSVRPGPNVRVRLCSIRCCQGHAFGTCGHPGSVEFFAALRDWSKVTSQMYIWHYVTNFAHYFAPMADLEELHANINLYKKNGVHGLFMQGCGEQGGGAESAALRAYVLSKLLWNPDQPLWPIVDEFLGAYYGKAAKHVRKYLDLFHNKVRRNRDIHPSLYDSPHHPLFSDQMLTAAGKTLREGEKLVTGKQQERVRLLRHGIDYLHLYRACGTFRRTGNTYRGQATAADRRLCEEVMHDWTKAGLTAVQENAAFGFSLQRMKNRLVSHDVKWLEDGQQKLAVLPGLGGRLLEWHGFGHQWLSQPRMDGPWWQVYPLQEGYQESAYLATYAHIGWVESYTSKGTKRDLLLIADLDHHLRFERRFRLVRGTLHITSRLRNMGDTPRWVGWAASIRWALPSAADIELSTADNTHRHTWADLGGADGRPLVLEGARLPSRGWQAVMPRHRLSYTSTVAGPQRAIFSRNLQSQNLAFDLRTDERTLAPKASVVAQQTISITRSDD
jgi:Domain of unknown function (DUF4838)/Glycosyl hydrolase family 67 N-terminus